MIDPEVCSWCVNREREICLTECTPEGKFRHLEPEMLKPWEPPPQLPPFREIVAMGGYKKLALLYLTLYYLHLSEVQCA